jgi:WD40 repeat protein
VIPAVVGEAISTENAAQLTKLATIGSGSISSVAWSPDGKLIALPGTVGVWLYQADDLSKPMTLIPNDVGYSLTAQFTSDSQHLIISDYQSVQVWDIATQQAVTLPSTLSEHIGFDISPDGTLAALGDFKGSLTVVDLGSGAVKTEFSIPYASNPITEVHFSPDGKRIAFTGNNLPVLALEDPSGAWNHVEGEPAVYQPETQFEGGTWSLHYNRDGSLLTARVGTDIYLWDTATTEIKTVLHTIPPVEEQPTPVPLPPGSNIYNSGGGGGGGGGSKGGGGDLSFSPDGKQLVTIDQSVRIWDVESGEARTLIETQPDYFITSIAFNADWTQMAQVDSNGVLHILDVETGEEVTRLDQYDLRGIVDVDFNADNTRLAAYTDDNAIHVWDVSDLNNVKTPLRLADISPHAVYGFQHLSFDPNQPQTLAAHTGNGVVLWDVEAVKASPVWENPPGTTLSYAYNSFLSYSPDGTRAVSGSEDATMAYVWDVASGGVLNTYTAENGLALHDAAFSPDGKRVAFSLEPNTTIFPPLEGSAQIYRVDVWDINTSEVVFSLPEQTATIVRLMYAPDGNFIATAGGDNTVQLWDAATGQPARVVENGNPVGTLAFSPDGMLLVTAEFDQTNQVNVLRVWDMIRSSEEPLATLDDPLGSGDLVFSRDGKWLAASSSNGTIDVWGVP